jgi:hypothetical protein
MHLAYAVVVLSHLDFAPTSPGSFLTAENSGKAKRFLSLSLSLSGE